MKYDINYIRKLLADKLQNGIGNKDLEKTENLKIILGNDNVFFMLDAETAVGVLYYLGIPEEKIKEAYLDLTSPEAFKRSNDPYISIGEK